jgi:deoxyribodipyrimidine photo-lyase
MSKITTPKHPFLTQYSTNKSCRENAIDQLKRFLSDPVLSYTSTRNHDFGRNQRYNTSCLSIWIDKRVLLEEEVITATLKHNKYNDVEKFIHEVFWRTYFKGWLEHRPQLWADYKRDLENLFDRFDKDAILRKNYNQAIAGKTQIACMNEWANELIETGYLHNHARMWFASIWIFTLKLPWQLGADFFLRHLHDGDAACNTLSWRWVAGLHTKGKHYVASQSNIEKFSNGQFSPEGLAKHPAPLTEDKDYPVQNINIPAQPKLIQNHGLIITNADCHPIFSSEDKNPSIIFALSAHPHNKRLPSDQSVIELRQKAINEAAAKAQDMYDCPIIHFDETNIADTLIEHCQLQDIKHLMTSYLTVGPIRDAVTTALHKLNQADIELHQVMRFYDKAAWPHTSKGFSNLKKHIPNLIEALEG